MKRQSQQILEQNREMEVFIHDLSSPLSSMDLCLSLLKKQISTQRFYRKEIRKKEIDETLTRAVTSLEQLNYIIEHGRGNHPPSKYREQIDILNEIVNIKTRYIAQLEKHQIHFEVSCDEGIAIWANKYRFIQVLDNLVKNSVEALQRCPQLNKQIAITVKRVQKGVQIVVFDNGCGIDTGSISDVFGLNFTTKPGHSGVGLWLVKQIVQDELGGHISLKSEAGRYTKTTLSLPIMGQSSRAGVLL